MSFWQNTTGVRALDDFKNVSKLGKKRIDGPVNNIYRVVQKIQESENNVQLNKSVGSVGHLQK